MLTPRPQQLSGAAFLADRKNALNADDPRVGKTGATIMACDYVFARKILVITTASGRPVWARGFKDWQAFDRSVFTIYKAAHLAEDNRGSLPAADVYIVSWSMIAKQGAFGPLFLAGPYDVLVLDESHYAGDPAANRTVAVYGIAGDPAWPCLSDVATHRWCLSGTPIPKTANSLHPMLRKLAPERLRAQQGTAWSWPDVTPYDAFVDRYCVVKREFLGGRWVEKITHSKNTEELGARLEGFFRRLTQADVGITEPTYEMLPLHTDKLPAAVRSLEEDGILAAAESGSTAELEMHLGPLRRLTGGLKAAAVAELVAEEIANGLDKIVLFCWHTDVGVALAKALERFGAVYVDGRSSPSVRQAAITNFQTKPLCQVIVGQLQALGEVVDLSAAAEAIIVEVVSVPSQMRQGALRITNMTQKRSPRVRVAALEGSIDEPLVKILIRRVSDIKAIMEPSK